MIINGKYRYSKGYIVLDLDHLPQIYKETVNFGNDFHLKNSFHISLVCTKYLSENYGINPGLILRLFREFTLDNELLIDSFLPIYRIVDHSDGRKSIIQELIIKNGESLYEYLRENLNINIKTYPFHVTIYVNGTHSGVGIHDKDIMGSYQIIEI